MTKIETTRQPIDRAPGDEDIANGEFAGGLTGYVLGFVLAAGLTAASFWIASGTALWQPAVPAALVALAIAQMGVHLVFFLHVTSGPDSTNNSLALAFGVLIVFLVMVGSLWIMGHLNANMASMPDILKMQR
ncbi:MAG: cytochrome o ubiquinol oxidase subunit IV [Cypionkella sp.]